MIKLSPSILSADFANLQRDIAIAVDAGAEYVHVDCMDGHFVPNLTIGAPVVKALRKATDATLDVHLMISNPDQYLDDFIKAGSDIITVHYEANGDTLAQVRKIKEAGVRACVSIKPGTPADVLLPLLPELDMVLIMTVEPGFGGQGYIDACTDKIRTIRKAIDENGYKCEPELFDLSLVANTEKKVPLEWINEAGNGVTQGFIDYCLPLIQGETGMVKEDGLPRFVKLKRVFAK